MDLLPTEEQTEITSTIRTVLSDQFPLNLLDPRTVSLWFPNNREAFEYNRKLAAQNTPAQVAEGLAAAVLEIGRAHV